MDLLPLFQWFEATAIGTVVRESLWLFPVIQCGHLLALAMLGGAVLVVDLRLLGLGLRSQPAAVLARAVHPWLVGSLAAMIATGIPMFLSEALKCYYSPPFWYKMGLLAVAALFAFTVRRKVLAASGAPLLCRLTAIVSLALWFGVGFSGRWIAFY
ncbi:MAG: DUF6644 family protein [Bryobacteraceae bacterium]